MNTGRTCKTPDGQQLKLRIESRALELQRKQCYPLLHQAAQVVPPVVNLILDPHEHKHITLWMTLNSGVIHCRVCLYTILGCIILGINVINLYLSLLLAWYQMICIFNIYPSPKKYGYSVLLKIFKVHKWTTVADIKP